MLKDDYGITPAYSDELLQVTVVAADLADRWTQIRPPVRR